MPRSRALLAAIAALILGACNPDWTDWDLRESQFGAYEIRQQGEDGPWVLASGGVRSRPESSSDSGRGV